MNIHPQSKEQIRKATHSLVERQLWIEQLLTRVQSVMHARGHERHKELQQLELAIRMEMEDSQETEPLYHIIWNNSQKLREYLLAAHHQLPDSDLFLCACIHFGISMSDVAKIKGVAPATINMNRYRLKKKLGLPPEEDLENYIYHLI